MGGRGEGGGGGGSEEGMAPWHCCSVLLCRRPPHHLGAYTDYHTEIYLDYLITGMTELVFYQGKYISFIANVEAGKNNGKTENNIRHG